MIRLYSKSVNIGELESLGEAYLLLSIAKWVMITCIMKDKYNYNGLSSQSEKLRSLASVFGWHWLYLP